MGVILVIAILFYVIAKIASDGVHATNLRRDMRAHSEQFWKDDKVHQMNFAKQNDWGYNSVLGMASQTRYSDGSLRYDSKTGSKISKGTQYDGESQKYKVN